MGNKVRGQTDFEVGDSTYSLHFTANGMCELESAAGCSTMAFLQRLDAAAASSDLSIGDVRLLFWAGLKEHHPDMTVQQAGSLMQELGGIDKAMALAGDAVAASMPSAEGDGRAGKGKAKGAS